MGKLYEDLDSVVYDNLVIKVGAVGQIDVAANQGTLERGSVLDTTGTLLTTGGTPAYILADDCETDESAKTVAPVYLQGTFIRDSLVVASGYTLTDANVETLRGVGIIAEAAK